MNKNKRIEKSVELGGRALTLQTGVLAKQATGSVLAKYGDTVVLATVVAAPLKADLGYFPLSVEYQERLYAGGRIKGSRWVKREGRPTDEEILTARLIDRSIRPLFPKAYKKEVQVIVTALSVDMENDPKILGAIAASAAISASSIPWLGPVAPLRVGMKDSKFFINPLDSEMTFSDLDLVVSSTSDAVVMIEAGAKEVPEKEILEGIEYAKSEAEKVLGLINDFTKEVGVEKEKIVALKIDKDLEKAVAKIVEPQLENLIASMAHHEGGRDKEVKDALVEKFPDADPETILHIFDNLFKKKMRKMILSGKRADGRKLDEIRPLSSKAGVLPRTHGSAIFSRGETQVLTITTLGAPSLEQFIETAEGEETKRYIHHYSMPPFATGEAGRVGYPNRREIGHGALAERALEPVIPNEDKFPYTIRVVSEVMSSNGSTSMASTCGSTLSLMDAGVPLASPVSGIAMGLVIEDDKNYAILSDIMGIEDFNGDMDFKVTGTTKGITAMQLDVKTLNLTTKILKEALDQAKKGRDFILESMLATISEPRKHISAFAPKVKAIQIPVDKIGELIGPGGKNIKKIMADTGAQVDVEDDGTVNVSGTTEEAVNAAYERVEAMTKEVAAGEIYDGEVVRIQPFGAFVNILPGKDGLIHISDMAEGFVKDPNDVVKIGQKVKVRVKEIDEMGRINLSMMLDPSKDKPREERPRRNFRGRNNNFSRGSRDRKGFSSRRQDRSGGGPHFPTSRFVDKYK